MSLPPGYSLRDGADAVAAQSFLANSYWNKGISIDQVQLALENSTAVSVWADNQQVAMARVVSDLITIAYLNDVYVLPEHQGRGLATAMLDRLRNLPQFAKVGRWLLFTKDAQPFYSKQGWREYPWPTRTMIIDHKVFPA